MNSHDLNQAAYHGARVLSKYGTAADSGEQSLFNSALIKVAKKNAGCLTETDSAGMSISLFQLMEIMKNAVNAKNADLYAHSQRVAVISYLGALACGMSPKQADRMYIAGALHDIGKIGIPDAILKKKRNLTGEEEAVVRRHPEIGAAMITPVRKHNDLVAAVLSHHERFDGRGYPRGLKGKDIPPEARIVAVADTLSMLTEQNNSSVTGAISLMNTRFPGAFDPDILEAIEKNQAKLEVWMQATE